MESRFSKSFSVWVVVHQHRINDFHSPSADNPNYTYKNLVYFSSWKQANFYRVHLCPQDTDKDVYFLSTVKVDDGLFFNVDDDK